MNVIKKGERRMSRIAQAARLQGILLGSLQNMLRLPRSQQLVFVSPYPDVRNAIAL